MSSIIDSLIERSQSESNDEQYWVQLEKDMEAFLREDHPISEKRRLAPLGWLEAVSMIVSGFEYERSKKS